MTPTKAWFGICALPAILTCALLYADPVAPSQPTKEADPAAAAHPKLTHGFRSDGIAFDGEHLWALDAANHRTCAIEKAAGKEHEQMSTPASDQEGPGAQARVLLDGVVADFKRITNDLEGHQVVVGDITYPQPAVYLTTHLVEMWAAGWKDADFDTLAAVSGASALFAYQPDEFMPKYANLHIGMDGRITEATGFGYEWVPFEDTDSAWPIIKESIDSRRPLKGWHWENLLVGGYHDAARKQDRKVFVMDDGPGTTAEWWTWQRFSEWTAEWPHFLGRHTERVETAPAKEIALRVMSDLVEWSANPPDAIAREYPEAKFGLEGIEIYAAHCADIETYDDWVACHPINPQWTVRNSTAAYLDQVAGARIFPAHIAEHITAAAREYRAAYEDWREFYNQLGHDAPENAGKTKERRLAGAAAIRSALEHEKAAIDSVRQALGLVE